MKIKIGGKNLSFRIDMFDCIPKYSSIICYEQIMSLFKNEIEYIFKLILILLLGLKDIL